MERPNQRTKSVCEVAKTNDANPTTREKKGASVALEAIILRSCTKVAIVLADAPRQIQTECQGHFSDGNGKCRAGVQDPDIARKTELVINVSQVIALDIEDRLQLCSLFQPRSRQI